MIFKIILIITVISLNQIAANYDNEPADEVDTKSEPSTDLKVKFINNQDIQLKDFGNAQIIKANSSIFLLNKIDLYALKIQDNFDGESNLKIIGRLDDINDQEISDIKASFWKDYLILVVALDSYYNVYVVKNEELKTDLVAPIEKLTKQGSTSEIDFFQLNQQLYCTILNVKSDSENSSVLYIYKWRNSHFTLLEKIQTKNVDELFVYSTETTAIVVTVNYLERDKDIDSDTVLNVYSLSDDNGLRHIQALYLDSKKTFPITLNNEWYFYAVSHTGLLTSYQWDTDNFVKLLNYKKFKNATNFVSREKLIIGQVNDHLAAYTNAKLSPAYQIPSNYSNDLSEIIIVTFNDRFYVTLAYKYSNDLMMRVFEVKFEDVNVLEPIVGEARDSDGNCVTNLRDAQKDRIPFIEIIKNMIPSIYYKNQEVRTETPVYIKTLSIAKKANIRRINVNADLKASIQQLKDGIETLKSKLSNLKNRTFRQKRHVYDPLDLLKTNTTTVKRLNIPKEMFESILIKLNGKATYKGILTTNTLTANSIKFESASEPNLGIVLPNENVEFDGINRIHNLQVETINGINWNDFYKSLYLKDSPQPIEGNLITTKLCQIQHLVVQSINEFAVSTFVTLNTDQEISSDIFIPSFHSVRIEADLINGVDFRNNVASLNENNVIETPVKILRAHIGNLTLANSEDDELIRRHIVGTKVEDLSQVYSGKVVIKGSLKLKNVILDSPTTNIFVDEQQFLLNVVENYWMKTVDQKLGKVIFSSVISTPQLFTESINNYPTANLIVTDVTPKQQVNLVFQKVSLQGNIYTDDVYETSLTKINKECVRRGSSTIISGTKTFTGLLSVNDFFGRFDAYPTAENFVLNNKNDKRKFYLDCTKQFELVIVNGNLEFGSDNLFVNRLNGVNLLEFFQNAVRVDQPTRLESLTFANVKVTNLIVHMINGHSFDEIVAGLEDSLGQEGNLKSVHINGSVTILGNLLVNTINDINFDDYLGLVVTSRSGGQIGGNKRFLAGLSVTNLNVRRVNDIDFGYWFENALHKHSEQFINQNWTLTTVNVGEMNANIINGIKLKEIIDLTADIIEIRSDIKAKSIDELRNMNGVLPCDVQTLDYVLDNGPTKKHWNWVSVGGYVEWPEDNSPLNDILKFAMTGYDQVITGDIVFTNITFINNCQSTGIINNVDLKHIFEDSMLKTSEGVQVIKGSKIFRESISVGNMAVEKDLETPFINDVNVINLNSSIFRYRDANIISGTKTFLTTPLIDRMILDGTINGVHIDDIVFANSTILPPIFFHQPILIREHLTITENINAINYNYLIDHIIRKTGPPQEITGMITFQNLILHGDTKVSLINGMDVNNVVLKSSDSIQEIWDEKTIIGDVYLNGPAVITNINGLDVVDAYSNSIFVDQNMIIQKLEVIGVVTVQKGLTINSAMNGMPIFQLINWQPPTKTELVPMWSNVRNKINEIEQVLYQNYGKSFHILYFDYASDIIVKFEANSNYPISFIVETVHAGEQCGLDHKCECPAQYDISLSPFKQIYVNRRQYFDRFFKMFGSNCNVTVKTNFLHKCEPNIAIQTLIIWSAVSGSGSLTINEVIFGIKLFEIGTEAFILINNVNGSITGLKLDQQTNNWFKSDQINGNNVHLDVLEWNLFKVLIVFSRTNEIQQHPVARLFFYNTDAGKEGFQIYQEIHGDYNLCSKMYMRNDDKFVLFLSKTESQFISIFMVHWGARFDFFQTLALDAGIKTFASFAVDDSYCLAIVTTTGYLYIYKYNNIEGWIPIVYGFFTEIESIVPFYHLNKIYLFVSMKNSATVIRVYSQGLH